MCAPQAPRGHTVTLRTASPAPSSTGGQSQPLHLQKELPLRIAHRVARLQVRGQVDATRLAPVPADGEVSAETSLDAAKAFLDPLIQASPFAPRLAQRPPAFEFLLEQRIGEHLLLLR